ncbi:hypothetical protein [Leptolyngbya sp. FACHB-261]|uniref:hypothetical protein n=1 Tax=Leptolyngbya sp. FACHB-261 TaxID=2692806 RepID=UPI00168A29F0|nr:hypothetical protein [Leptolyngbya sp. FACHB-261]MBD2102123.1 hypothetical protein [Leptolyngbya sp. FACHB-261]
MTNNFSATRLTPASSAWYVPSQVTGPLASPKVLYELWGTNRRVVNLTTWRLGGSLAPAFIGPA